MSRLFIPLSNQVKNVVSDLNALTPSVPQSQSAPPLPRPKRAGRANNMPSAHSAPQATQPQSDRHYEKYRLQRIMLNFPVFCKSTITAKLHNAPAML